MDPNLWFNGAHFEDLVIWSPSATGYYSDHLDFLTHGISSFGSSQDMVQFDQEVETSFGDLAYTVSPHPLSNSAGMDIGNNPQGTTSHQLVVGPSSSSSGPQRCESEIPRPRVEDRAYRRFSIEDVKKLIQGVEKHGRRWKYIKLEFFEDSPRKKDQLKELFKKYSEQFKRLKIFVCDLKMVPHKEKWRHMLKSANTQTDPMRKELYSWAKNLDATLPK